SQNKKGEEAEESPRDEMLRAGSNDKEIPYRYELSYLGIVQSVLNIESGQLMHDPA
ncbi:hypothetical protein H107_02158, partial [Trichophyton rubrum CBS 202.88]